MERSVHYQEDDQLNDAAKMLLSFLEQESHRYMSTPELVKFLLEIEPGRKAQANMLPAKLLEMGYISKAPKVCGRNNMAAGWKIAKLHRQARVTRSESLLIRYDSLPTAPGEGKGFFYLVRRDNDGIFKLGITRNLKQRIVDITFGCGSMLTPVFLCQLPNYLGLEDYFKVKFDHLNILGEWFNLSNDELNLIVNLSLEQPDCTSVDILPPIPVTLP